MFGRRREMQVNGNSAIEGISQTEREGGRAEVGERGRREGGTSASAPARRSRERSLDLPRGSRADRQEEGSAVAFARGMPFTRVESRAGRGA